jgi:hypothetical protein
MSGYDLMIALCMELDRRPMKPADPPPPPPPNGHPNGTGQRPGDDYAARTSWADILQPAGWKFVYERGGCSYWKRPDKAEPGVSATTGVRPECNTDLLYVFSTNAGPLQPDTSYSKFAAYAVLNHQGNYGTAAKALAALGFGDDVWSTIKVKTGGQKPRPSADNSDDPLDADATAHDLILHNSTIRWAWEKWLPVGVLTILASEPGVGKTRLCCDLAKRIYRGLPWPDGTGPTLPERSTTLWIPADNQHPELGSIPTAFQFPPTALYLNATRRNPFEGTMLDTPEDLADFEARIKRIKPALVFVDTCLNATDKTSHKPEDAKAFFVPLQQIAARQQIVLICVTHLNASGKPLGRRIMGQGRVVIQLEHPDPEGQPNRRKLHVVKSNSLFPPALGVTMQDDGNEYDLTPPEAVPEESSGRRERPAGAPFKVCQWLAEKLRHGPRRVSELRNDAESQGHSSKSLYAAKRELQVEQFESQGRQWWKLTAEQAQQ